MSTAVTVLLLSNLDSFSWLIAVASTSSIMLSKTCKSGHCCLVPDLEGNAFNLSPLSMMLSVGLSLMAYIMLRYVSSISTLLRVFIIINECRILSKAFFVHTEIIIWFFFFRLLRLYITLTELCILNHPCIPGIGPAWSWYMILLMYFQIQLASILMRIFASMFISDIVL